MTNKDGREIEIDSVDGYEDDIQIESAYYIDTGDEVTEQDLDYIYNNYSEILYEKWMDLQIRKSESYYEGER